MLGSGKGPPAAAMLSLWGLPGQHPVRSPVGHTQDPIHGDGLGEAPCPLGQEGGQLLSLTGEWKLAIWGRILTLADHFSYCMSAGDSLDFRCAGSDAGALHAWSFAYFHPFHSSSHVLFSSLCPFLPGAPCWWHP